MGTTYEEVWTGLEGLANDHGYRVSHDLSAFSTTVMGVLGETNHADKTVRVGKLLDRGAATYTLAHEVGHVLLHEGRDPFVAPERDRNELEAEATALRVFETLGLDVPEGLGRDYIANWTNTEDGHRPATELWWTGSRENVDYAAKAELTAIATSH